MNNEQILINRLNSILFEIQQLNSDLQVIAAHFGEQADNADVMALVARCKQRAQRVSSLRFSVSKK